MLFHCLPLAVCGPSTIIYCQQNKPLTCTTLSFLPHTRRFPGAAVPSGLDCWVICNGEPCYWSVTESEPRACQTDWCCCSVGTSSLKANALRHPRDPTAIASPTRLCFSFDATLIVSGCSHWWTAVICKIDSPQESSPGNGQKNNPELGLMKWFSPVTSFCRQSLCTVVWQASNNRQQLPRHCRKGAAHLWPSRRHWPWLLPPTSSSTSSSSQQRNFHQVHLQTTAASSVCLKIVPHWHIWCSRLGSNFTWISLSAAC